MADRPRTRPARTALLALPTAASLVLLLSLLPAGSAGSSGAPEVSDASGDSGLDELDLRALWVDTADDANLTFHLVLGKDLPAPPTNTSRCDGTDCVFASLTYSVAFRVLGADGKPLPAAAGYNHSLVSYRHGPGDGLQSRVGTVDDAGTFVATGAANVTVLPSELVLRVNRSDAAVNMPLGPTPGATVDGIYAFDAPQACTPAECAPILKPTVQATPGIEAVNAGNDWDRAPDAGSGNATFPSPPPAPAQPAPASTTSPTQAPSATSSQSPSPAPAQVTPKVPPPTEAPQPTPRPTSSQQSPGPAPLLLMAGLAGLAAIRRRN